ncbi:MAG: two-component system, OmpR family, sensor histidine kinase BaeS [Thermoanaerobacteraceae bacterium]|nr:two-component system, OmpR family, sensor histidine kinase BaeS [Thermoanaerobacteraceae bacterium]
MKKTGIGYRITAGLVVTALLTAILSILLLFVLTEKAFNDYIKQNRIEQAREISGILGDVYDRNGWEGVRSLVEGASMMRQGHKRWMGTDRNPTGMGPFGGQGMGPMMGIIQRQVIVTDPNGNIIISSEDISPQTPISKSQWDLRVPIFSSQGHIGYLIVWSQARPAEKSLESIFFRTISRYSFLAVFFGLVIAIVVGYLISRQLTSPIKKLSDTVRLFTRGERDIRLTVTGDDELGTLAADFNAMADSIKKSEELRKNLTADVAHELRTPLSILRGTLESIQAGVLSPTPEVILSLQDEIIRMSRLVKDLSDLSRAEAGNLELNREEISPVELKEKFSYFKTEAEFKGIDFIVDIPPDLPKISVDVVRITQVISNLLTNALRHTASGKIELSAKSSKDGVLFSVKDTGCGIKQEDLPHVFDRFYRAEKSRSRTTGGMGLGLAIARSLVEIHGGKIWVESEEGKGAEFKFFIPIIK